MAAAQTPGADVRGEVVVGTGPNLDNVCDPDVLGWFGLEYDGPSCVGDDCEAAVEDDGQLCEECADQPTMTVRVFDRAAERASWGHPGGGYPVVRTVTISTKCPTCGGVRGVPQSRRQAEDGEWYTVDVWANPCGHGDSYVAVLAEAGAQP